ncbi:MAG: hypothetical protein D6796_17260 [Caldilineae bacterium]|nr:MAG: hypothetical protein D6796_17260 [Caldilineae bacterium]
MTPPPTPCVALPGSTRGTTPPPPPPTIAPPPTTTAMITPATTPNPTTKTTDPLTEHLHVQNHPAGR